MDTIRLTDLINVETLQKIQDTFTEFTGIATLISDADGIPLTKGSGFNRFCSDYIRKSYAGRLKCIECDKKGGERSLKSGVTKAYTCHAGLMDFTAPIIVEGKIIGCFAGGQIRSSDPDENFIKEKAAEYGINPDEYLQAFKETKFIENESIQKAAKFLGMLASIISELSYKNYIELEKSQRAEATSKSQSDFVMQTGIMLEQRIQQWYSFIDDKIQHTQNLEVKQLLNAMLSDGKETRNVISDSIEYIRASDNSLEIHETEYKINGLRRQILDGILPLTDEKGVPVIVTLGECSAGTLFGDSGRIGHMLNKTLRAILREKQEGELIIEISTKKFSYSTLLKVSLIDIQTVYDKEKIKALNYFFNDDSEENAYSNEELNAWMSLEKKIIKSMYGTIDFNYDKGNMVINLTLPQLAL